MIVLGQKYKDKISGFEGVATGFVQYLTGCNQALLAAKMKKDDKEPKSIWFDEQRLDPVGKKVISLDNSKTPGPDLPAPIR